MENRANAFPILGGGGVLKFWDIVFNGPLLIIWQKVEVRRIISITSIKKDSFI